MSVDPTAAQVVRLIALVSPTRAKPKDISPEHRLSEDLGIDSVASLELLWMMTTELQLEVEFEHVPQVATVGETVEFAQKLLAAKAA